MSEASCTLQFHGVRDGLPRVGREPSSYGGNTACIELRCGGWLAIFDAGTGIWALGVALAKQVPLEGDLLFSSLRYDQLCGLPFFAPAFNPQNHFRLWAGPDDRSDLDSTLTEMMSGPLFPIPPAFLGGVKTTTTLDTDTTFTPTPGVRVHAVAAGGVRTTTSYRVTTADRIVVYLAGRVGLCGESQLVHLLKAADLVVYAPSRAGRAAPDWRHVVDLCAAAGVGTLILSHHGTDVSDEELDALAEALHTARPGSLVAREGMQIKV